MSSTVWLKFKNSVNKSELTLEDDYIDLTRAITTLGPVCAEYGVADINLFVDYDEVSNDFEDEIPNEVKRDKFTYRNTSELIKSIAAINKKTNKMVSDDLNLMMLKLKEHEKNFDKVALLFIM